MEATTREWRGAFWIAGAVLCLLFAVTAPALAAKGGNGGGGGKGGGEKGGGKGGGDITPVQITFADEMGQLGYRISGDGLGAYVHDADGSGDGVEAFLGTGGAEGDIFLWLSRAPSRGIWFDFSNCHPDPTSCNPPFQMGVDFSPSISVAARDVVADGLFGMAAGQTIEAPMEFAYDFNGPDGPGHVYFDRDLKGKNPCKNKSLNATVTRPGAAQLWTVSVDASILACAILPQGTFSGQYVMPFRFTVEVLP